MTRPSRDLLKVAGVAALVGLSGPMASGVSVVQFVGGIQLIDITAPNPIRDALIFFSPGVAPHDALVLAAQFNGAPDVPAPGLIGFGDFIDLSLGVISIN